MARLHHSQPRRVRLVPGRETGESRLQLGGGSRRMAPSEAHIVRPPLPTTSRQPITTSRSPCSPGEQVSVRPEVADAPNDSAELRPCPNGKVLGQSYAHSRGGLPNAPKRRW